MCAEHLQRECETPTHIIIINNQNTVSHFQKGLYTGPFAKKSLGPKKNVGPKTVLVPKKFWSKKILGPKIYIFRTILGKKICVPYNFG